MSFRCKVGAILGLALTISGYLDSAVSPILVPTPIHEAFVPKFTDASLPLVLPEPPPAPLMERIVAKPAADVIWIPGYWAWSEMTLEFRWVCGVWRRPPLGQRWIQGHWTSYEGGWAWAPGFWSPVPQEQLSYIDIPPPASIDDKNAAAALDNQCWIPGYWEFAATTHEYTWLSGMWVPFNANWVLAPASYVWQPAGYVFIPMYWDHPIDRRGYAYSCEVGDMPAIINSTVILQQLLYCYPDYIPIYWHWWHFHPGWWDGCWCMPPWWGSPGWWACPWADLWGFWWWWCHPGFLPPDWLSIELASEIAPPPQQMIEFMKKAPKPKFFFTPGKQPILPQGPPNRVSPPRPPIPNDVTPGGQVTPPTQPPGPGRQVTPPPPPAPPYYPPQRPPQQPPPQTDYPRHPEQPRRPPVIINPDYFPEHPPRRPPSRYPPKNPDRPPSRTPPMGPGSKSPPSVTPPSRTPPTGPGSPPSVTPPSRTPPTGPGSKSPPSVTPPFRTPPNYNPNFRPNLTPKPQQPNLKDKEREKTGRGQSF